LNEETKEESKRTDEEDSPKETPVRNRFLTLFKKDKGGEKEDVGKP